MKKFLSFMVMAIVMLIPIAVSADVEIIKPVCTEADANNDIVCTVRARFDSDDVESLVVKITEEGGADVLKIEDIGTDWRVSSREENGNVWTVNLTAGGPGQPGDFDLFKLTYKASGTEDCKIRLALGNVETTITPEPEPKQETPKGKCTYDKTNNKYFIDGVEVTEEQYKEQCPKTGSTLPYLALGAIVLLASAAYVATKNKAKMYKI